MEPLTINHIEFENDSSQKLSGYNLVSPVRFVLLYGNMEYLLGCKNDNATSTSALHL